ncbi:MAG: hypothetical protein KIC94_20590 [Clostridiales bacterium]|nr:hypothetical protein [Clostridiales bacterium]
MNYKELDIYQQDQDNDVLDLLGKFESLTDHKSIIKVFDDEKKLDSQSGIHVCFCLRGYTDTKESYLLILNGQDEIIDTIYGSDLELIFQSENIFLAQGRKYLILAVVEVTEYIQTLHKFVSTSWIQTYI